MGVVMNLLLWVCKLLLSSFEFYSAWDVFRELKEWSSEFSVWMRLSFELQLKFMLAALFIYIYIIIIILIIIIIIRMRLFIL